MKKCIVSFKNICLMYPGELTVEFVLELGLVQIDFYKKKLSKDLIDLEFIQNIYTFLYNLK